MVDTKSLPDEQGSAFGPVRGLRGLPSLPRGLDEVYNCLASMGGLLAAAVGVGTAMLPNEMPRIAPPRPVKLPAMLTGLDDPGGRGLSWVPLPASTAAVAATARGVHEGCGVIGPSGKVFLARLVGTRFWVPPTQGVQVQHGRVVQNTVLAFATVHHH